MINIIKKLTLLAFTSMLLTTLATAEAAQVIDAKANVALQEFYKEKGAQDFIGKAYATLIFPSVIKGGIGIGGEYGEGALRVDGKTVAYYKVAAASFGFQLGVQKTSYIFAFKSKDVLDRFMVSNGWEAGADGSITVAKWGAGKDISSISFEKPIYAFVFGGKGFMYNLTFKGTKFTKINPK